MNFRNRRIKDDDNIDEGSRESEDEFSSHKDQTRSRETAPVEPPRTADCDYDKTLDAVFLFKSLLNQEDSNDIGLMNQTLSQEAQRA